MSEKKKTLSYAAVAILLAAAALATAPRKLTPDAFFDRGEAFFPEFQDPNAATTLEVVEFDEATASASPFKVTNQKGKWTIPSHHNYPADGKERLAKTAAGVIGIHKDDVRSDNVADHEACGVIDPLDEKVTTLKGRGKRVTIKGEKDQVLADLIVGRPVPEREGFRFVRLPGQKRVYAVRMDIDISTKFEDWIERDLLLVERDKIGELVLEDYSIDERTFFVDLRDRVVLTKREGKWQLERIAAGQEVDESKVNALLTAVDELNIVGVRPKPAGLSRSLRRVEGGLMITQSELLSLQSRGYYFARDGRLLSNEGELRVRTSEGITYTLRFGEIVYGRGEAVTAGTEASDDESTGAAENRYLFITADFDPRAVTAPEEEDVQKRIERGEKLAAQLNARFADWYYVISAASFDKVHLKRKDLVRKKS
jgi:hypothetical protein